MKKLKSILSVALILIVSSLCLIGCKSNNNTISLAEAKTIIVNALAIQQAQATSASQNQTGNRDILEKLGSVEISASSGTKTFPEDTTYATQTMQGYYEYSNGLFQKYLMEMYSTQNSYSETTKEYSADCQTVFISTNDEISTATIQPNQALGYSETLGGMYIQILNALFTDKAFEIAYDDTVKRVSTSTGFNLILSLDLKGYSRLITLDSMTDEEYEVWWQEQLGYANDFPKEVRDLEQFLLTISFDKNQEIISLDFAAQNGVAVDPGENVAYFKTTSSLTVSKSNHPISQPQWVEDYLAQ